MDHDGMMSRQLLGTLAILACGLIPDRFAGARRPGCASLSSGLFNQSDASADRAGLLRATARRRAAASTTWATSRPCAVGGAPAAPSRPPSIGPAGHAGQRPARGRPEAVGSVVKGGIEWRTNAQGMRDRSSIRSRRPPARSGSPWWATRSGPDGGSTSSNDSSRSSSESGTSVRGAGGPWSRSSTVAVPGHSPGQRWYHFRRRSAGRCGPDLVIYESTEADVGWDERRLRYVLPAARASIRRIYRAVLESARRRSPAGARSDTNGRSSPIIGDPRGALPSHGGQRLPDAVACRSSGC